MDNMKIFDFLGMTKEMEGPNGPSTEFDREAFQKKMGNVGKVGREMSLYNQTPTPSSPSVYGPKAISSPAPLPAPAANPYMGSMQSPAMAVMQQQMQPPANPGAFGMQPVQPPMGIGAAPSMDQLLRQLRGI